MSDQLGNEVYPQFGVSLRDLVYIVHEAVDGDDIVEFVKELDDAYGDDEISEELAKYFAEKCGRDTEGGA